MPVSDLHQKTTSSPRLVIFFGMTASGKSTLATQWSRLLAIPYYNTDRVRKELVGLQATDKRPDGIDQGIYAPALSARTYTTMLERARSDFASGSDLVALDGSYSKRADRDKAREMAAAIGAECLFIYCSCSEAETRRRLAIRAADTEAVSDGRWEIYLHQLQSFERPQEDEHQDCCLLDTEDSLDALVETVTAHPALAR